MKKEIRVNNEARRLLTDEELERVAGGATPEAEPEAPEATELEEIEKVKIEEFQAQEPNILDGVRIKV